MVGLHFIVVALAVNRDCFPNESFHGMEGGMAGLHFNIVVALAVNRDYSPNEPFHGMEGGMAGHNRSHLNSEGSSWGN